MAEAILQRFVGRQDVVAVGSADGGFAPHRFRAGEIMKPAWLRQHIEGRRCLGFYLMRADNTVLCSCVDFDNKEDKPDSRWREKTEQLYFELCRTGLRPVVELSQSGKAAHVWLFFDEPVAAYLARAFWRAVSDTTEIPMPETYPRQDRLKEGGIGNLVRYPLWRHSRFVDVEHDWAVLCPIEALSGETVSHFELAELTGRFGGSIEPPGDHDALTSRVRSLVKNQYSLLGRRWAGDMRGLVDGSRSAAVQSIACELVRLYVPTEEVRAAIREWCRIHDYDKGQRPDWVATTVAKAYGFVISRKEIKSKRATTMRDACFRYLDIVERGEPEHIGTGISELDASIDGIGVGEMAIVAARPGHGKSAFALQWVHSAALSGTPCLVISEEMSDIELGKRALLTFGSVDQDEWRSHVGLLRHEVEEQYDRRAPIYVVENCNSIDRCEEVIDQFVSLHGVGLVVVDYLQLLGSRAQSRYEVVTDISRRLKQAAKRNDVSMVVLSQLNRDVDKRDRRQPKLSDLRESGQIEQDADLILFLQWPIKFDLSKPHDLYLVWAGKRRNGPIRKDRIAIRFDANKQRIGS